MYGLTTNMSLRKVQDPVRPYDHVCWLKKFDVQCTGTGRNKPTGAPPTLRMYLCYPPLPYPPPPLTITTCHSLHADVDISLTLLKA